MNQTAELLHLPKKCTRCGEMKEPTDFHFRKKTGNLTSWCRQCKTADQKQREAANPEKYIAMNRASASKHYHKYKDRRRLYARRKRMNYRYGVSYETAAAMLAMQNDACAICNRHLVIDDTATKRGWNVDHCHETGKIRGILCTQCNTGIGLFHEDRKIMTAAIAYIKVHERKRL